MEISDECECAMTLLGHVRQKLKESMIFGMNMRNFASVDVPNLHVKC